MKIVVIQVVLIIMKKGKIRKPVKFWKKNIIEYISAMIMITIFEIKDLKVIQKNPENIRNTDKFPENKTIISYLRIKPFIM